MRTIYPSDVTREQFALIEVELFGARKATRPRVYEPYDIFCAVPYRLREGCRWRSLPHDFPKWQLCYHYYDVWRKPDGGNESIIDRVLKSLAERQRSGVGRAVKTTMLIVDSKSVKNTDTSEKKGFDAGEKKFQA